MNVSLVHTTATRIVSASIVKEVFLVSAILGMMEMESLVQVFVLNNLFLIVT